MKEGFTPREYQEALFDEAIGQNTLVVLPTGLGKTAIAAMMIDRLVEITGKAVFLAPTKPLVEQHEESIRDLIPLFEDTTVSITGSIKPKKRAELFEKNNVVIATPQTIRNDLESERITLQDTDIVVFDEAHRGKGNYAYTGIAEYYVHQNPTGMILALTASPGSDKKAIKEVIENLHLESLAYKSRDDLEVKPYTHSLDVDYVEVEMHPGLYEVRNFLQSCFDERIKRAAKYGYVKDNKGARSRKVLLKYMRSIQAKLKQGEKHFTLYKSLSLIAEGMKVQHAMQLIESQGLQPLLQYLNGLKEDAEEKKSKAVQNLVKDGYLQAAHNLAENLVEHGYKHPKMDKVVEIVNEQLNKKSTSKIIVFTQFRDSAVAIQELFEDEGISAELFLGQAKKKDTGLTQDEQRAVLRDFRNNDFTCLVATSVGEEGLDIPQVDLVVFFEPVPSAIRTVQRRGRTGRQRSGKVITLLTKNTRDEAIRWAAHHKEQNMYKHLEKLKHSLEDDEPVTRKKSGEGTLEEFYENK